MRRPYRVLFHLTVPPSAMAECDAVVQEVSALLQSTVSGRVVHLHPGGRPDTRWPRLCWGLQRLPAIWVSEKGFDLHHIFNPDPFDFPMLRFLRRPLVYSAVGGAAVADGSKLSRLARRVARLVVPSESDRQDLQQHGISNATAIAPGIDTTRFGAVPPPPGPPWTLLVGSAPWTEEQFHSKGVDALLATVQMPTGIPVATVAVDSAANGAYLAAAILSLSDGELAGRLAAYRDGLAR